MIPFNKFIAVILTIWFPLFSGHAMAASIAMQAMSGECETGIAAKNVEHDPSTHHASSDHPNPSGDHSKPSGQSPVEKNSSCKNCGVCHLACSGYMATTAIKVPADQPLAQLFAPSSSHFQSITTAPLDPPPLARV